VNRALSGDEWKAATVLAGSVVEALLLWAIKSKPLGEIEDARRSADSKGIAKPVKADPNTWSLVHYIGVASELNVIEPDTATQASLAKDFRNLIHPGKATKQSKNCDRGTALSAVAALELVIRDLTKNFPSL
jgi:hypothetical protein